MEKETQHEPPTLSELIVFRVPQYIRQQVNIIAERQQQTMSECMRTIVSNHLKRQKT